MSFLLLGPTPILIPDQTNWKMALILQLRDANENWNYTEPLWNRYSVKVSVPSSFIGITSLYTDVFQSTESFPHRFLEIARLSRRSQLPTSMVSIEARKWTGPKSRIRYRRISVGKGRLHTVEIRQARRNCSAFVRSSEIFAAGSAAGSMERECWSIQSTQVTSPSRRVQYFFRRGCSEDRPRDLTVCFSHRPLHCFQSVRSAFP